MKVYNEVTKTYHYLNFDCYNDKLEFVRHLILVKNNLPFPQYKLPGVEKTYLINSLIMNMYEQLGGESVELWDINSGDTITDQVVNLLY